MIKFHAEKTTWVILFNLFLLFSGLFVARNLGLDSDLKSLLPAKSVAVVNNEIISPKAGGGNDILVLIHGGSDFNERVQAATELSDYIRSKEGFARSVQFQTPKDFLEFNKFLFLPMDALESIREQVDELREENEDFTDPLGLERIIREEQADQKEAPAPTSQEDREEQLEEAKALLTQLDEMRPYYMTEDGEYIAIRILPLAEGLNLQRNRELLQNFRADLDRFKFQTASKDIELAVHGGIERQLFRYESILADVSFGAWGLLMVMLIAAFYFRSFFALLILIPPLVVGMSVGLGITYFVEGQFNTIAIFLILVVFGLGIDFGIHLLARYLQERKNHDIQSSLMETWRTTGRATLTSAAALLAGFALLAVSSFQGFAQFGRVAVIMLACTAGAYLLFMPSWILLVERWRYSKALPRSMAERIWSAYQEGPRSSWKLWTKRLRYLSALLVPLFILIALWGIRFDYAFHEEIRQEEKPATWQAQREIFTERMKVSAYALFRENEKAYDFIDFFRENRNQYPNIAMVSGLPHFYPRDQWERIALLQEISDGFEVSWLNSWEDEQTKEALIEIKNTAYDYVPFSFDEIPEELISAFVAADQSGDQLILLFDEGGPTDGRKAMRFSDDVFQLLSDFDREVVASGPEIIFADVVRRVTSEGPWLVFGMLLLVLAICWLDFRNLREALITMSPVLFGFLITGFVLAITDTKINFYNMVALASLGSIVVDNSIHFYHRYRSLGSARGASYAISPTVTTCTFTSIFGYLGMTAADHSGIRSLGELAVLGLLCCLVSAVVFFPAWLERKAS